LGFPTPPRSTRSIVLAHGRTLARLMILHDVGCAPAQAFVVKKLDSDYFVEE
jgi:restriction endonuclease Mrr